MRSVVEKWLRRQMAGEIVGNLAVGGVLGVLALPLVLLHVFLLWVIVRVFSGGNPLAEIFGRGPIRWGGSMKMAVVLFVLWFLAFLYWDRRRAEKSKWGKAREENPSAIDVTLAIVQILFAAPSVVMAAVAFFKNVRTWATMNARDCAKVIARLLDNPHRVALETLKRELTEIDWEQVVPQLRLIPGVVFLSSAPAGFSLTGEMRKTFSKHSWDGDWKPPPREERFEFVCLRCGQKLRLRRFQTAYTIRCPQCQARYRGRLDVSGRLKVEPEPERRQRVAPERTGSLALHYQTLDLPRNADLVMLRRAYRRLMKQHHPDLFATADAAKRAAVEEKAKRINEAYHALLDHLEPRDKED